MTLRASPFGSRQRNTVAQADPEGVILTDWPQGFIGGCPERVGGQLAEQAEELDRR
jgi:hypothetical protein